MTRKVEKKNKAVQIGSPEVQAQTDGTIKNIEKKTRISVCEPQDKPSTTVLVLMLLLPWSEIEGPSSLQSLGATRV